MRIITSLIRMYMECRQKQANNRIASYLGRNATDRVELHYALKRAGFGGL
jgi:hypothetical protein